jgi:uncharacterized protein
MLVDDLSNKDLRAAVDLADSVAHTVLAGYRGSIAHGTHGTEIDDVDVMGVYIPRAEHYFGLFNSPEGVERGPTDDNKYDFVLYEFRKFIRLCFQANPNVLCMLWLNPTHYLVWDEVGQELIAMRDKFLSKQLYHSFGGYAHGQLKRMTHGNYDGYMSKKRRARYEKHGYDCKNASHMIRLLRMGIEVLTTGELVVLRPDASELLGIKNGEWNLHRVQAEADRLRALLDEAFVRSPLPTQPDRGGIEQWAVATLKRKIALGESC